MFLRPTEIVEKFKLSSGMVVADFGSGSGHYALAAAKELRGTGTVYAIDVQKDLLAAIKTEAESKHLNNLEIIWGDVENDKGSRLADESVDFVIISNLLFQAQDKAAIARETKRVLKIGGMAAIIDWSDSFGGTGPTPNMVVPKSKAEEIFITEDFKLEKEFDAGTHHYGMIFKKNSSSVNKSLNNSHFL
ncbi:TPA: hypothetical protein DEW47_00490 [Patescibacteria group bacterium]|nr:hypothetical protein [Patescibacteria group bacterium]